MESTLGGLSALGFTARRELLALLLATLPRSRSSSSFAVGTSSAERRGQPSPSDSPYSRTRLMADVSRADLG